MPAPHVSPPPAPRPTATPRQPRGAGLPDALLACAVLGLGVGAWLRLPASTASVALAAHQQQRAAQAAANLADWLHALRGSGFDPLPSLARRQLLPATGTRPADCRARECSPEQLAEHAWREWANETSQALPGARAEITCRAARDAGALAAASWRRSPATRCDAVCVLHMHWPGRGNGHWSLRA